MATAARPVTLADVLERADALVPRLRERARLAEDLRRLPDETVMDFVDAGLFRVRQPARYGGSWVVLGTPIFETEGAPSTKVVWTLLPQRDWQIVDTWYAAGLKGTASNDIRVPGAFVPHAFTLDTAQCDGRPTPGSAVNPAHLYHLLLWPIFPWNVSTPALGIARGALQAYVEYLGTRPERANMVQRQLRIAEFANSFDIAGVVQARHALGLPPIPASELRR